MFRLAILISSSIIAAAQPVFEIASVRQTPSGKIGYTAFSPPGAATFSATNVSLEILVSLAFGMDSDRISGKQSWLQSERYDVTGKAEGGGPISSAQLKPMLQHLLAERFKLVVHRENKDFPGYALVLAKDGPRLHETKGGPAKPMILQGAIRADNVEIATFAGMLSRPAGRPVVDQTGIKGNFDFNLEYAPEGATDSTLPSVFTALQEQFGLKLLPQKIPLETLVIDHVEKLPTEN